MPIGSILELWRYPVKSMGGERLDRVIVGKRGFTGDRLWALRDETTKTITGAKKYPVLLQCEAHFARQPVPGDVPANIPTVVIRLPDGTEIASDDSRVHAKLSELVGKPLTLCALRDANDYWHYRAPRLARADLRSTFGLSPDEPLPDLSMLPFSKLAQLAIFATPPGTYFDAYPLHVLTTKTLRSLRERAPESDFDARRFRPNLLIETNAAEELPEFEWCGRTLRAGAIAMEVEAPTVRCSMPSRVQGPLQADRRILTALSVHADRCCGVYASVGAPGLLRTGDPVEFARPKTRSLGTWTDAAATRVKQLLLRAATAVLAK